MLRDCAEKYYFAANYNCAETIIRAANEYYDLGLHDRDMIMMAGFGGGIQTGSTCGALLAAVSVLSMKSVEQRAHESADIHPLTVKFTRAFKASRGSTMCKEIKPVHFSKETRCLDTVLAACDALEEVLADYTPSF